MRMYELWKLAKAEDEARRLEDAGGAVLFGRRCDAEEYPRAEADFRDATYTILPVTVGRA